MNMNSNYLTVWKKSLSILKDNISSTNFNTWFIPIVPIKLENNTLTIQVPTHFFYEYLEEHYIDILKKVLRKILGEEARLEYNVVIENNQIDSKGNSTSTIKVPGNNLMSNLTNKFIEKKAEIETQLNTNYTFDDFIEGECNRLAYSAGLAVAKNVGKTAFNPLFIHGDSGLGKTHLAQAIGIDIKDNHPNKTVLYTNANIFQTQFTESVRTNTKNDFLSFYQRIDILIIDDIHELAGKEKTQNTFFHIFNQLHQSSKQLILTSDKAPVHLEGLEARLISRFKWGLSVDLRLPDKETRIKILQHRAYKDGVQVSEEVLNYIADNVKENIRVLEGVFIALLAHSTLMKKNITIELAQKIITKLVNNTSKEVTIGYIQKIVCDYLDVNKELLFTKSRKRDIVQARQIAMYFSKKYTNNSLSTIGAKVGNKDHATVLHACKMVNNLKETDKKYRYNIEEMDKILQN